MRARYSKLGRFDFISLMLCVNIAMLLGLFCFEFSTHWIWGYLTMIYIANYINFIGFNMLLRRLPTAEGPILKRNTNTFFIIMNILYILVFILAWTPKYGPFCTSVALYPPVFTFVESLLVMNAMFHHYMHCQKYWLKWEDCPEVIESMGMEHELGFEPISVIKPVFLK